MQERHNNISNWLFIKNNGGQLYDIFEVLGDEILSAKNLTLSKNIFEKQKWNTFNTQINKMNIIVDDQLYKKC